ncbi:hypothetical protein ACFL16_02930 [Patescibacteria group bacterium]
MIELTERDQEVVGRCAEENAPDCQMDLGGICEGCSVYQDRKGGDDASG